VAFLLTFGEFDFIMIIETEDPESAAFCSMALSQTGVVQTQTICAFSPEEAREAIVHLKLQRGWEGETSA